jgi:hypothetical protein
MQGCTVPKSSSLYNPTRQKLENSEVHDNVSFRSHEIKGLSSPDF